MTERDFGTAGAEHPFHLLSVGKSGFVTADMQPHFTEPQMPPDIGSCSNELLKGDETMSLIRWDPFREFNTLPARLGFLGKDWDAPPATATWNPSVDIFENDNDVVIKAEVPGMNAKDFDVKLENNVLTIKGERHFEKETKEENYHRIEREYGKFTRSFALPTAVNGDKVTAEYKDGVLKIVLPKMEETKTKPIKVAAA
jgi:HSP20 family protein